MLCPSADTIRALLRLSSPVMHLHLPVLRKPSRACCAWPTSSRHPQEGPPACRPGWQLGMNVALREPPAPSAQGRGPSNGRLITARTARKRPAWMSRRAWEPVLRMRNTVRNRKRFTLLLEDSTRKTGVFFLLGRNVKRLLEIYWPARVLCITKYGVLCIIKYKVWISIYTYIIF